MARGRRAAAVVPAAVGGPAATAGGGGSKSVRRARPWRARGAVAGGARHAVRRGGAPRQGGLRRPPRGDGHRREHGATRDDRRRADRRRDPSLLERARAREAATPPPHCASVPPPPEPPTLSISSPSVALNIRAVETPRRETAALRRAFSRARDSSHRRDRRGRDTVSRGLGARPRHGGRRNPNTNRARPARGAGGRCAPDRKSASLNIIIAFTLSHSSMLSDEKREEPLLAEADVGGRRRRRVDL